MKQRRGGSNTEDKISKLPDELIHRIFSFFDMKYAVQTCVLSKRWRYIWTSLPTLNFDHTSELYPTDENFVKVVDKVLEHRSNKLCNIQQFHINKRIINKWYSLSIPLDTWISAAVKAKVQDIFIPYLGLQETEVPGSLFSCKSLKRLILETQGGNLNNLPRHEEEVNRLISSCPVLHYLDLMFRDLTCKYNGYGYMYVKIHSLTLKHLKISKGSGTIMLDLYVPNLVSVPTFESAIGNMIEPEDYYGMSKPMFLELKAPLTCILEVRAKILVILIDN
ncbi:putative F-box protein At1g49610 [Papaver somniferum]|uniref:putative F-box protein At1g49610 n=1 Tax=Papaver somniferum TaxID=3469 RepID=UPI000E6FE439|nr:putative F-box protein At1g49610 [Papaver somniferum]